MISILKLINLIIFFFLGGGGGGGGGAIISRKVTGSNGEGMLFIIFMNILCSQLAVVMRMGVPAGQQITGILPP